MTLSPRKTSWTCSGPAREASSRRLNAVCSMPVLGSLHGSKSRRRAGHKHRQMHLVDRFGDLAIALRSPRNLGQPATSITLHMPTLENSRRCTSPSRSPAPCCKARFTIRMRARRAVALSWCGKQHTGCTTQGKACSLHVAMAVEDFHVGNQLVIVAAVVIDLHLRSGMPTRWKRQRAVKHGAGAWRFVAYLSVLLNGIREKSRAVPCSRVTESAAKALSLQTKDGTKGAEGRGQECTAGAASVTLIPSSGLSAPASMVSIETKDCST